MTIEDLAVTITGLAQEMRQGFASADKKTEDLATVMRQGFAEAERKTDEKISRVTETLRGEIESLAAMTQNGFAEMHNIFATKDDFKLLAEGIGFLRDDVREIKDTVSSLVKMEAGQDREISSLDVRVTKLEHQVA